ncbi:MAG: cysteine ABC transporter ATP-binding protein [Clostridiales bacterium]|nr:MAG: cysteine ABC transporter ATP-binding protein [Clostridiales bacterium]
MMSKRLLKYMDSAKKNIYRQVIFSWISLVLSIVMMFIIGTLINDFFNDVFITKKIVISVLSVIAVLIVKFVIEIAVSKESYHASKNVKIELRTAIYKKLLRLGMKYRNDFNTSEIIQVSGEGVEQLETYFGAYMAQFFYSLFASVTLFIVLSFVDFKSAFILFICVPLIPLSIVAVQKIAKKVFKKYWGEYTKLGDDFLENVEGLTTLKIYKSDDYKHKKMNERAELFRKMTMRVLKMQLNSIIVMDTIAYSGAALGIVLIASAYRSGSVGVMGAFAFVMLSAEFFLPLRKLGSFFHVATGGVAASEKIFELLDYEVSDNYTRDIEGDINIEFKDVSFSYDKDVEVLHSINLEVNKNDFISIVGESGSGKSTIAALIVGEEENFEGEIKISGVDINEIRRNSLRTKIARISSNSYIFSGTVRENLLVSGNFEDDEMWKVLKRVDLYDFLKSQEGLDTKLSENGSNISGGQKQRLSLARAILYGSEVYVFDEATSNIDSESESKIIEVLKSLTKDKTVILISHRLLNVVDSDKIYVIDRGNIMEIGSHAELISKHGKYTELWDKQMELEKIRGEEYE